MMMTVVMVRYKMSYLQTQTIESFLVEKLREMVTDFSMEEFLEELRFVRRFIRSSLSSNSLQRIVLSKTVRPAAVKHNNKLMLLFSWLN